MELASASSPVTDTRAAWPRAESFLWPAPWCVVREQEEGYLVYNPRTDEMHLLPPTGFHAYRLCDGLRSVEEVAAELAAASGVSLAGVRRRVRAFLGDLVARGLLMEESP